MNKVLFVCTGNTCRSPMAEGLFRKMIAEYEGIECIGSAGVAAFPGDTMSPETSKVLKAMGAELEGFRSRPVSDDLLNQASHVFAMTQSHLDVLDRAFPEHADKSYLICDFVEIDGRVGQDVPDPIGMGARAYQKVAQVFEKALPGLIRFVEANAKEKEVG
jgi:protein-tyrosine-phosphatase